MTAQPDCPPSRSRAVRLVLALVAGYCLVLGGPVVAQPTGRIALLLPLSIPPGGGAGSSPSRALSELAAGALLAGQDLANGQGGAAQGTGVYVYDTHRHPDTLARLLALPEMAGMDILIGPVLPQGTDRLAAYALSHGQTMVNPLATEVRWQRPNPAAYLAECPPDQMAGLWRAQAARRPTVNRAAIIYGLSMRDSLIARHLRDSCVAAGWQVPLFKKVARNSAANLPKFISEARADSSLAVFVPNDEELVRLQLPAALQLARSQADVITYGTWLEQTDLEVEVLEALRFRFWYPEFADPGNERVRSVESRLRARLCVPTTEVGLKGYDLVMALAQALAQAGTGPKPIDWLARAGAIDGPLLSGYEFGAGGNRRRAFYQLSARRLERIP